jgi:hypothetical protein
MSEKLTRKIYIWLFAALYLSVALVSGIHAVSFFSLANNEVLGVILAITFEIGQAAVLFSLLTNPNQRKKVMPWLNMGIFCLIQILGNIYSSYKYIVLHSMENLKYFKEPIFIWFDMPDNQVNVVITYLVGAILPISALMLTEMLTSYLYGNDNKKEIETKVEDNNAIQNTIDITNKGDEQSKSIEGTTNTDVQEDNRSEDLVDEVPELSEDNTEVQQGTDGTNIEEVNKVEEVKPKPEIKSHFVNLN